VLVDAHRLDFLSAARGDGFEHLAQRCAAGRDFIARFWPRGAEAT
jgi:hypothetical protein